MSVLHDSQEARVLKGVYTIPWLASGFELRGGARLLPVRGIQDNTQRKNESEATEQRGEIRMLRFGNETANIRQNRKKRRNSILRSAVCVHLIWRLYDRRKIVYVRLRIVPRNVPSTCGTRVAA